MIAVLKRVSVGDVGVYTILDTMSDTPIEVSEDIMNILRRSIADNNGVSILHWENEEAVEQHRKTLGAGTTGYHLRMSKERIAGVLPFYGYSDDVGFEPPLVFLGWEALPTYYGVTDSPLYTSSLGVALFAPLLADVASRGRRGVSSLDAEPETLAEEYALRRGYKMSAIKLTDKDIPLTSWAAAFLMEEKFATNLASLLIAARNLWMSAKNKDFDFSKKSILLSIEGKEELGALEIVTPDDEELRCRSFVHSIIAPDRKGYMAVATKHRGNENTSGVIRDVVYHGTSESFFVGYSLRESFLRSKWRLVSAASRGGKAVEPQFETEKYFRKVYNSFDNMGIPEEEVNITYRDTPLVTYLD